MFSQPRPIIHAPPSQPPNPPLTTHSSVKFDTIHNPQLQENRCVSQSLTILPFLSGQVNSTAYSSILDSCSDPMFGKQVHAHLLKNGFHEREFVGTKLLQMYGKFGRFHDALLLFDKMSDRNLYTYTALLNLLLDNGLFKEALKYFERLLSDEVELEFFVFPVVVKICNGHGRIELGKQLHGLAIKTGVLSHIYVGNALIDMYGKCGSLNYAEKVLNNMAERDCVSWNSLITACSANGMVFEALEFLEEMSGEYNLTPNFVNWSSLIGGFAQNGYHQESIETLYKMRTAGCAPNAQTLANVLPACARMRNLRLGKEIYGYITRHGFMSSPYIVNGLIDLYRRCNDTESALNVFSRFSERDEVSFNTMISGYCNSGDILRAKDLFDQMEYEGKTKDLISWNSMISGYADNSMFEAALRMFLDLLNEGETEPNSFTMGSAVSACTNIGLLKLGKGLHSYCIVKGLESNLFVGGALVEMYCRCQDIEAAEKAFCRVPERDIAIWNSLVSGYAHSNRIETIQCILLRMRDGGFEPNVYTWNGIIAGYVENGHNELALRVFTEMQASKMRPDNYTIGIVLPACSKLATIRRGKQVHAYAIRREFKSDAFVTAALIDMYSKCGSLRCAKLVHKWTKTKNHNLVTQNAMLNAYAMHGHGEDGVVFFLRMLIDGFVPDSVTFLAVLSSCVHAGSVDTGKELFDLMKTYSVMPTIKHYTCMVDLLSRAGQLKEAYEVVVSMRFEPDSVIWGALLGGCIIHGDVDLGERAADKLIDLQPDNSGNYVMLANLYASNGMWKELEEIRRHMKAEELHKDPGCSWVEVKDEMHVFMACDRSHRRTNEIYGILDNLNARMRLEHV